MVGSTAIWAAVGEGRRLSTVSRLGASLQSEAQVSLLIPGMSRGYTDFLITDCFVTALYCGLDPGENAYHYVPLLDVSRGPTYSGYLKICLLNTECPSATTPTIH